MFANGANSGHSDDNLWISEIPDVVDALKRGEVILYPTDTIWGLGCDATNEKAVLRVFRIKHRPTDQPLIILVDSIEMLKDYASKIHPRVETLLSMHHKPLTVIYPSAANLPAAVSGGKKTIAIRVVNEPFCQEMIRQLGRPVVSTSANVSGTPWPKGFGEISSEVLKAVQYVVRYRRDEKETGEPSVIATFNSKGTLDFLRE